MTYPAIFDITNNRNTWFRFIESIYNSDRYIHAYTVDQELKVIMVSILVV